MVQGVGFRPHVYRLAQQLGLTGTVANGKDGVHIYCTADIPQLIALRHQLEHHPPPNARIVSFHTRELPYREFSSFSIVQAEDTAVPDLLIPPDLGLCEDCRRELHAPEGRRSAYPFTTCVRCGPRYSILSQLPYDRENTTMKEWSTCIHCDGEYNDPEDRRYYSQTNSCSNCAIPMHLYDRNGPEITSDHRAIPELAAQALREGRILAVKGIGGYLLLCDATQKLAVQVLRTRKHRPAKPFAVCYPQLEDALMDVELSYSAIAALQSAESPIVLCPLRNNNETSIALSEIAPGLKRLGVLLPYTPLLELIASSFQKPFVATSGNLSGSPIIFTDEEALRELPAFADLIITYEREILIPQDDSVVQFTDRDQRIILRRSRGLAPNFTLQPFPPATERVLALGADLKSAFALLNRDRVYVSQYLGNLENFPAQEAYDTTLRHLSSLLQFKPERMLCDRHPAYYSRTLAENLQEKNDIPLLSIQHHEAHFAAVLAENKELFSSNPILGVIWDGTGWGSDEQVWGGEFFLRHQGQFNRKFHLKYFRQLLGDKMSREPRLSALSLLNELPGQINRLAPLFSPKERDYYQRLLAQPATLHTSSMGRFLDGIAVLLGLTPVNTYEGQAALQLQSLAEGNNSDIASCYEFTVEGSEIDWQPVVIAILADLERGLPKAAIARSLFRALIELIRTTALLSGTRTLAFSGGVFQNALLCEGIQDRLGKEFRLLFHQELSPNDECIGFGQLAWEQMHRNADKKNSNIELDPALLPDRSHFN